MNLEMLAHWKRQDDQRLTDLADRKQELLRCIEIIAGEEDTIRDNQEKVARLGSIVLQPEKPVHDGNPDAIPLFMQGEPPVIEPPCEGMTGAEWEQQQRKAA